jgi:hypothetical protein
MLLIGKHYESHAGAGGAVAGIGDRKDFVVAGGRDVFPVTKSFLPDGRRLADAANGELQSTAAAIWSDALELDKREAVQSWISARSARMRS